MYEKMKNKFKAIDLFCGCGGFSYGFQEAGFEMLLGIDVWKDAVVTYQHNFPGAVVINDDIEQITVKQIMDKLNVGMD